MTIYVTNEGAGAFRIVTGNRIAQTIPPGGSVILTDAEFESIPFGKRGPGAINPTLPGAAVSSDYTTETDKVGDITYVGEAVPDSDTGDAVWRIKRVTNTNGDFSIKWADGDTAFDNAWDDHLGLVYS